MSTEEQNGSGSWQNTDFIFKKKVNKYKKKERERKALWLLILTNPKTPTFPRKHLKLWFSEPCFLPFLNFLASAGFASVLET